MRCLMKRLPLLFSLFYWPLPATARKYTQQMKFLFLSNSPHIAHTRIKKINRQLIA